MHGRMERENQQRKNSSGSDAALPDIIGPTCNRIFERGLSWAFILCAIAGAVLCNVNIVAGVAWWQVVLLTLLCAVAGGVAGSLAWYAIMLVVSILMWVLRNIIPILILLLIAGGLVYYFVIK